MIYFYKAFGVISGRRDNEWKECSCFFLLCMIFMELCFGIGGDFMKCIQM